MEFLSSTDKTIKLLKSVVEHNFKKKKKKGGMKTQAYFILIMLKYH